VRQFSATTLRIFVAKIMSVSKTRRSETHPAYRQPGNGMRPQWTSDGYGEPLAE